MTQPLPLKDFARILKYEIGKSPYTAYQVLDHIGVHVSYLSKWANEITRPPSYIEVVKLANFLGRPVELFLYGKEQEPYVKITKTEYEGRLESIIDIASEALKKSEKQTV